MLFINTSRRIACTIIFVVFYCSVQANEALLLDGSSTLSIQKAIEVAQKNDPWLTGNLHQQKSIEFNSTAANTLPDPKVSLDFINLPTDGFNSSQEPITQFKVGITQVFPRGKSLSLASKKLQLESEAYPFQRQDRKAKISVTVGKLWLNLYQIQKSIVLIEKHGAIFEQLIDITQASYSSALGVTRQQDIIQAQLELTHLEERLSKLEQDKKHYEGLLLQWLTSYSSDSNKAEKQLSDVVNLNNIVVEDKLPLINLSNTNVTQSNSHIDSQVVLSYFVNHPAVLAIDKKIQATTINIQLTKQKYKPEWEIDANYGHRRDDSFGRSRADLLSVGVTFDVPLFTRNKQDKQVQSSIAQTESIKTEKHLLIREMLGTYSSTQGTLQRLKQRQVLYTNKLLPQVHDQAQSLLTSYTNDDGAFTDVVRSHLLLLNAEIDQLTANVDEQKLYLTLKYLLIGSSQLNYQRERQLQHQSQRLNVLPINTLTDSESTDEK